MNMLKRLGLDVSKVGDEWHVHINGWAAVALVTLVLLAVRYA